MKIAAVVLWVALTFGFSAHASDPGNRWQLAEERERDGVSMAVFVEADRTKGRPAFRIETTLDASPLLAAATLMDEMLEPSEMPKGQSRRVIERTDRGAVVYSFIDLPFMLSDRELALRIVHSEDPATGIHRIEWVEANEVLPAASGKTVRLEGANGFWEFRPDGQGGTIAVHMTQTEIGGSIPASIGDRLMKGQAIESVDRLREQIEFRKRTQVASPPPGHGAPSE